MSSLRGRGANFTECNQETLHQRAAGLASFASFSAHWRAWQGLPLLHASDVVYLTPADFHSSSGKPLPAAKQRRLFRRYVQEAARLPLSALRAEALTVHPSSVAAPGSYQGADITMVRMAARFAKPVLHQDYLYGGRDDIAPYEREALLPTRPYGIPVVSEQFEGYWMSTAPDDEDEEER